MFSFENLKSIFLRAKGASFTLIAAFFFLIWSAYEQFAVQFYYTTAYGNQQTYTAGAFHSLCQQYYNGIYTNDPAQASASCATAATDEAAKGHAFILAIVLGMIGAYWMRKRLRKTAQCTDPGIHYHTGDAPASHSVPPPPPPSPRRPGE